MPATVTQSSLPPLWTHPDLIVFIKAGLAAAGLVLIDEVTENSSLTRLIYEFSSDGFPSSYFRINIEGNRVSQDFVDAYDTEADTASGVLPLSIAIDSQPWDFPAYLGVSFSGLNKLFCVYNATNPGWCAFFGCLQIEYTHPDRNNFPSGAALENNRNTRMPYFNPTGMTFLIPLVRNEFSNNNMYDGGIDCILEPHVLAPEPISCVGGRLNSEVIIGSFRNLTYNSEVVYQERKFRTLFHLTSASYAIEVE